MVIADRKPVQSDISVLGFEMQDSFPISDFRAKDASSTLSP
jgi:hypothetical protein